ncbi:retrovirus-related pol polyprotein from transposon TNT 1-94 [Tanacetum coccineum]
MYVASLKSNENYKAHPYQYASPLKHILKAKAKPFPPCTYCGFNDHRPDDFCNYPKCAICASYDHFTSGHNHVILVRGEFLAKSSRSSESLVGMSCTTCGSNVHSTTDHNDFEHFKRGSLFGTYTVDAQGFDEKQGTIFNANKEIVLIVPRKNDVYLLDMLSLTPNGACFFSKAFESVNWLWHKRLSDLNFKNINKLAKQNKVLGLPSLVYSKDKPCSTCEKGKHHRASFKTKQNFSIKKCLHFLHMDLFGPVSPMKKSQAAEMIMSFIEMVENQNDVKLKQIRTDNRTEFRNSKLESKFDAKADDGYLGHSFVFKAFRVFNTRRQQIEETYHVTFDERMEAIRFINTLVDEIGIDDSFRYPPRNNIRTSIPITEPLVPKVTQSQITHHESTSSHPAPQDRWSRDQHIKLVNNIGKPTEGMLKRSMAAKLIAASASECLFADFLFEIEPKKVSEALKHPGWVDAMQEELNHFYRNKV